MKKTSAFACLAILLSFASAYADQGGFTNSGGTLSGGTSVTNPPGTLTIAGDTLTFQSTDGATAITATFFAVFPRRLVRSDWASLAALGAGRHCLFACA